LIGLVYETSTPRTIARFTDTLKATDPDALSRHVFGSTVAGADITSSVLRRARAGDADARGLIGDALFPGDRSSQNSLRRLLEIPASDLKRLMTEIVIAWHHDVFSDDEAEAIRTLASDVRAKRVLAMTSTDELVRLTTNGIEYWPEPRIRKILLVPSLITKPWVATTRHHSMRIFCYPADDEAPAGADEPPARLLRLQRALAHPERLQILRLIASGVSSSSELSGRLGLSSARLRTHLVMLRAARLVDVGLDEQVSRLCANVPAAVYRSLKPFLPPLAGDSVAAPAPAELRRVRRRPANWPPPLAKNL
jgi:DNA-binding transcriptional ArsR family regulator